MFHRFIAFAIALSTICVSFLVPQVTAPAQAAPASQVTPPPQTAPPAPSNVQPNVRPNVQSNAPPRRKGSQSEVTAPEKAAIALIRRILDDPMMIPDCHGARLERRGLQRPRREQRWGDGPQEIGYDRIEYTIFAGSNPERRPVDSTSIRLLGRDAADFMIFLTGEEGDTGSRPSAQQQAADLDAFAARHWPGVAARASDSEMVAGYRTYAVQQQEAEVFTVSLQYRPDGKIYRVVTIDARPALKNHPVPPPPTQERIIAAVREALLTMPLPNAPHGVSHGASPGKAPRIVTLEPVSLRRSAFARPGHPLQLSYSLQLRGHDEQGKLYSIFGSYDEATQIAWLEGIRLEAPVLEAPVRDETPADARPPADAKRPALFEEASPIVVTDALPEWSADGSRLFFITNRSSVTESPWARKHGVFYPTVATCTVQDGVASGLSVMQLLKPAKSDNVVTFDRCLPSPSARYLALANTDGLFVCDTRQAAVYHPVLYRAWRPSPRRWLPVADEIEPEQVPESKGIAWLPDERGLLLAHYGAITAVRWTSQAPELMSSRAIVTQRTEFRFPCLSDGKENLNADSSQKGRPLLAYARQDYKSQQWDFVVAPFEPKTMRIGPDQRIRLPGEPTGIACDAARGRWLVMMDRHDPVWVQPTGGAGKLLRRLPVRALQWGETKLRITGAAINPVNGLIVLAAEMEPGRAYPEIQVQALSTLFMWDGQGTQVKPLIEPNVVGLPLWKFPKTNSPWATFVGDVEGYRLRDYLDPSRTRPTPVLQPFDEVLRSAIFLEQAGIWEGAAGQRALTKYAHPDNRRQLDAMRLLLRGDVRGVALLFEGNPPTADEWEAAIPVLRRQRFEVAASALGVVYRLGRVSWRVNNREMLHQGVADWARIPPAQREPLTVLMLDLMNKDQELIYATAHAALNFSVAHDGDDKSLTAAKASMFHAAANRALADEAFGLAFRLDRQCRVLNAGDVQELAQAGQREKAERLAREILGK
jgi:hypothetical protein